MILGNMVIQVETVEQPILIWLPMSHHGAYSSVINGLIIHFTVGTRVIFKVFFNNIAENRSSVAVVLMDRSSNRPLNHKIPMCGLDISTALSGNSITGIATPYFFMCLRMVSASRPWAMGLLAICCAYQTVDMFPRVFFRARYSFRQPSYMA